MNLNELDNFKLSNTINFNDKLNPKLFTSGEKLHDDVRKQLLIIAEDFIDHLGIKDLDIVDIRISGSNAAYTYTTHSDIDLHILVDIGELPNDEIYRELFNTKKVIYNDSHNIKIHGYDVELYVEDSAVPVKSLGEYSVLKNKWIKYPSKLRANFDEHSTRNKFVKLIQLSELALRSKNLNKVENILNTIKKYRQSGLEKRGEFGPENLAYKALRSRGIVEKLYNHRDKLHSQELSIESKLSQTEDWHPNDTPPGPETKPTMPKGTVRVDVSDVYDWYKLGQHISNMKGLGKHDFGKGPPSTILSFGDEDLEHKYIQDLERTGLTTTDIDPASHKRMPGQKVDPTFNVDENLSHFMINLPDIERGDKILHPQWGPCVVIGFKNNGTTAILRAKNDPKHRDFNIETWRLKNMLQDSISESSGYIPSEKEKNDPRFKTALTVDVKPYSIKKNAKKLGLGNIHRTGVPPIAKSNGTV